MSSSNPFGKLKVEHDSESEEEEFTKVKSNKPVQQLFIAQEQKKKKNVLKRKKIPLKKMMTKKDLRKYQSTSLKGRK